MKTIVSFFKRTFGRAFSTGFLSPAFFLLFCLGVTSLPAQVNQTFALSPSGVLYTLNPSSLTLTAISGTAPSANNANALGYAPFTNTFYFFANSAGGSSNVFESFVPGATVATGRFTVLSKVNSPTGRTNAGCVSTDGKGYYCMDTNGYLYYYNIAANTWRRIATITEDENGTNISSTMAAYNSGDMAFDGNGNLWFLGGNSSANTYSLFVLAAPVPDTTTGKITLKKIVAPGATLPDNSFPVGISFNTNGQMYLSTFRNNLYLWNGVSAVPAIQGNLGRTIYDLASGDFPFGVLATRPLSFKTTVNNQGGVRICWPVTGEPASSYTVERSSDGRQWTNLPGKIRFSLQGQEFSLTDVLPLRGTSYYRIREKSPGGTIRYSDRKQVVIDQQQHLEVWPNPVFNRLHIKNRHNKPLLVQLLTVSGQVAMEITATPGLRSISVNGLASGQYFLVIKNGLQTLVHQSIIKQ